MGQISESTKAMNLQHIKIEWRIHTPNTGPVSHRAFLAECHCASVVWDAYRPWNADSVAPYGVRIMLPGEKTIPDGACTTVEQAKAYAEEIINMWFVRVLKLRELIDPQGMFQTWMLRTGAQRDQKSYDAWLDTLPDAVTNNLPLMIESL